MYYYDNSKREIRAYALHNVLKYLMKECSYFHLSDFSRYNYQK